MPTRRVRSASGQRTTCEDRVPVPTDWLLRTIAANGTRTVSDAAVQPKPFTGKADQDPEGWFEFLNATQTSDSWTPPSKRDFSVFYFKRARAIGFQPCLTPRRCRTAN
jgi:hypothetical protein